MTDDQTIDSIRYMPYTKRLLGRKGTTFNNYHATQPLCCPSRASFLTGQYPHNHGVLNNTWPYGYLAIDFAKTLYTAMHDSGYRTGWIGKVANAVEVNQGLVPEPGFDEWLVPQAGSQLELFDYTLSDNGLTREVRGSYQNYFYGSRASDFLSAADDRPFLLTLSVISPHWSVCPDGVAGRCPPIPAPQDLGSFRRLRKKVRFPAPDELTFTGERRVAANRWWRREVESMQSVDRIVAGLIRDLRRSGELDNTYVIFQSDNGLDHGEHQFIGKNLPWDRSVRVPLMIRGPGFEAGRERNDLTANVDLPTTILDAAGVAPPLAPDGYSLLSDHRRRALLLERLVGTDRARQRTWQQIKTASGWTYWRYPSDGKRRLFNLRRDPAQSRNLMRARPRLADRLQARIERIADCADPCP